MNKICPHYKKAILSCPDVNWEEFKKCELAMKSLECDLSDCGAYPCGHVAEKRMSAEEAANIIYVLVSTIGRGKSMEIAERLGFQREKE